MPEGHEASPPTLSYWRGYIIGTNRAEVLARLYIDGDALTGRVCT
jgi:hypothetical protein